MNKVKPLSELDIITKSEEDDFSLLDDWVRVQRLKELFAELECRLTYQEDYWGDGMYVVTKEDIRELFAPLLEEEKKE